MVGQPASRPTTKEMPLAGQLHFTSGCSRMPRSSSYRVAADRSDHQYFTVVPHVVLALCRDPYEFMLWAVVKTVAGDGECTLSVRDLARLCGCGIGKVTLARAYLLECGLLTGELTRTADDTHAVWHLSIPDLWPDNTTWRATVGRGRKAFMVAVEAARAAARVFTRGSILFTRGSIPRARGSIPRAREAYPSPGEQSTRDASLEDRGKEVKED